MNNKTLVLIATELDGTITAQKSREVYEVLLRKELWPIDLILRGQSENTAALLKTLLDKKESSVRQIGCESLDGVPDTKDIRDLLEQTETIGDVTRVARTVAPSHCKLGLATLKSQMKLASEATSILLISDYLLINFLIAELCNAAQPDPSKKCKPGTVLKLTGESASFE